MKSIRKPQRKRGGLGRAAPPPRAPSSRYSPARLPPTPPAPPLSLALAEPSGPALRAPLARPTRDPVLFDHDLDPQAYPPVRVPICGGSLDGCPRARVIERRVHDVCVAVSVRTLRWREKPATETAKRMKRNAGTKTLHDHTADIGATENGNRTAGSR